jgi:hypothetical protein
MLPADRSNRREVGNISINQYLSLQVLTLNSFSVLIISLLFSFVAIIYNKLTDHILCYIHGIKEISLSFNMQFPSFTIYFNICLQLDHFHHFFKDIQTLLQKKAQQTSNFNYIASFQNNTEASTYKMYCDIKLSMWIWGRGCDHIVVGFTTTYAINAYHHSSCEFKSRPWRGVLDTTLCDKLCLWLAAGCCYSPGTLVSSTNKTDSHDITEILLKVAP